MAHTLYNSIGEAFREIRAALQASYGSREAVAVAAHLLEHVTGVARPRLSLQADRPLQSREKEQLRQALARLLAGEPIQHIFGIASFYGREFRVGPEVLIPRQETEELVHWVLNDFPQAPDAALDIGTGSGCIALTLALEWGNQACITAIDISQDALAVAKENAVRLGAEVKLLHLDLFQASTTQFQDLDLIVSNPPYVTEGERAALESRVKDYEPATALFVPDHNPIVYYHRIAELGMHWLRSQGCLYVELNEAWGQATKTCFEEAGYEEVVLRKDLNSKDRMLRARKKR